MLKNKPRFAVLTTFMFLVVSLLTLAFSPPVRAAVLQFVGSYNGANIAIDPETDAFVVSGDTTSVLKQEAAELFITNKDGSEAVAVIKPDTESVALGDLLGRNPNFVMPTNLPEGYTADADAIHFEFQGRPGLMVSWHNKAGERITFYRGEQPANEIGTVEMSYVVTADLQGNDHAQLTWEADGYFYQIIATDETLTESDLRSIIPL
jgi:hypothetical protein